MYNTGSQIKFKSSLLRSGLCDYSDAYIIVSETIIVREIAAGQGNDKIEVVFEICAPFADCIKEINNIQIDNAKDINIVMPMHNIIEYSNDCSKRWGGSCQYYRDEPALNDSGSPDSFPHNGASFKSKQKITGKTEYNSTKAIKITVPLKYFSKFCRTVEIR